MYLDWQVTAYYAPQFNALHELIVEGGQPVFLACLSRCKKWLSQGGKSNVYFAKTRDERYVVKQLTRSEKQSFLDFAPAYFRSEPHVDRHAVCAAAVHINRSIASQLPLHSDLDMQEDLLINSLFQTA